MLHCPHEKAIKNHLVLANSELVDVKIILSHCLFQFD